MYDQPHTQSHHICSSFRKKKKVKTEDKSTNKKDTVAECSCSSSFASENSETDKAENKVHDGDETEESKEKHERDSEELSDREIIIDVNEKGHCSFTTVNGLENQNGTLQEDAEVTNENDIDETSYLPEIESLKECELIIDVNEDGKCKFKVIEEIDKNEIVSIGDLNDATGNVHQCECETESDLGCLSCKSTGSKLNCKGTVLETQDKKSIVRTKNKDLSSIHSTNQGKSENSKKNEDVAHDLETDNEANVQVIDDIQLAKTCDTKINAKINKAVQESEPEKSCDKSDKDTIAEVGTKIRDQSDLDNAGLLNDVVKPLSIPEECDVVALDCEFVGVGPHDQSALGLYTMTIYYFSGSRKICVSINHCENGSFELGLNNRAALKPIALYEKYVIDRFQI